MLSRIRRKAAQMLWPAAAAETEAGYYVSKYLREDLGTAAQLEAGLRDNAQPTPTPPRSAGTTAAGLAGDAAGRGVCTGGVSGGRRVEGDRDRGLPGR